MNEYRMKASKICVKSIESYSKVEKRKKLFKKIGKREFSNFSIFQGRCAPILILGVFNSILFKEMIKI